MNQELMEDLNDIKEIKKEKEETEKSKEKLATWNPGQGLSKESGGNELHHKVW